MLVRVLGSAAGGGVPQWNCGCRYCAAARREPTQVRTGCSVAVSADGSAWILCNAAAELPSQLATFSALHPPVGARCTPFGAIVLTDAELDHTLGLLMIRQAAALTVAATASVRLLLERSGVARLLAGYLPVAWREIPVGSDFPLDPASPSGLCGRVIAVGVTFARTRPWLEAVASSLTELFSPGLMRDRLAAMRRHYPWIDPAGYAYFESRTSDAAADSEVALDLVMSHCRTRAQQDAALAALQFKCDLLWALLDSIEHSAPERSNDAAWVIRGAPR